MKDQSAPRRGRGNPRKRGQDLHRAELLTATLAQVGAAPDLESALKALVRGAMLLLGGSHGLARLFDLASPEPRVALYVEANAGGKMEVEPNPQGHLQPGTFGWTLHQGGPPVLVDDFWTLDPARYTAYLRMREQGLRSSVNVPIDAGGKRIGSLHLDHPQPGFFTPVELETAAALAAQAGAAIERVRLESARRETQRRLEAQNAQLAERNAEAAALRELDRLKNEFIRSISHELRTPLTVLHGYAQQLHTRAKTLDPATVERMAGTMLNSSTRLSRLVGDLLDFARLERGELEVRPGPVDVAPVLREAVADARAEPGGGRVVAEIPDGLVACADPPKVRQVVANLLDNAFKYAPDGPIAVRAKHAGPAGAHVRIEVEDWGPGVPVRERARIWEKFFRGSSVAGLNMVPGGGVGLAVVRALVAAQGGRAGLETPGHRGCRFWVELPGEAEVAEPEHSGRGARHPRAPAMRVSRRAKTA